MRVVYILIFFSVFFSSCNHTNRKVENIYSFAKVYGYVRWFYPSDEATQIDWNRFAVYGIKRISNARSEDELKQILLELFKPIAPAINIENEKQKGEFNIQNITPKDIINMRTIAWQHYGVYLSVKSNIYESIRTNRDSSYYKNVCLFNSIDDTVRGQNQEFKLVASVKRTNLSHGNAYIVLGSGIKKEIAWPVFLSKSKSIITPNKLWKEFEKTVKMNIGDDFILFGIGMDNSVNISVDNIKLFKKINNNWISVKLKNGSFEKKVEDWQIDNFLYNYKLDSLEAKNGKYSLKINSSEHASRVGEYIKKKIGNHLIFSMPLALYGDEGHTYPIPNMKSLKELNEQLSTLLNTDNISTKLANVVIAWNVFQHFYPYFDVVRVNWEKELIQTLYNVYSDKTEADYFKTLCKMIVKLKDGHGVVYADKIEQWGLPIMVSLVENKIVVIASSDTTKFLRGDIITSIDGKSALEELQEQESLISGSPKIRRFRALNMFSSDFSKHEAYVTIIRDKKRMALISKREIRYNLFFNPLFKSYSYEFSDLGNGIYYLNSSFSYKNYNYILPQLLKAKGIIIASSSDYSELIPHIIKVPVISPRWNIPVVSSPDRNNIFFDTSGRWKIEPKGPLIRAKLVFLTYPYTVSSGETFLGIVKHYKLGKLVGDTTAGTNGNVNFIALMDGYSIMWTGMKVLKHDGSTHHLIGFKPDYPISRTIKAIKEDRDEYIEKAKKILQEEVENP